MYNQIISEVLNVTPARARLVEAFLRLQYGTLDALSRDRILSEYTAGGISEAIDEDAALVERLADSYGLRAA